MGSENEMGPSVQRVPDLFFLHCDGARVRDLRMAIEEEKESGMDS